jgi:hypothetical protein
MTPDPKINDALRACADAINDLVHVMDIAIAVGILSDGAEDGPRGQAIAARSLALKVLATPTPHETPSAQGEDSARLDWLEKYLMSLSRLTSPDMSGLRYVGQCSNPAKERGEGGPSYLRIQGATIRAAIDAARKETAK